MRIALLAALLALAAPSALAGGDAAGSLIETLTQRGTVTCRPALRYFCLNIHAGCSGRSTIAAAPFTVELKGDEASLSYPDGKAPDAALPLSGPVKIAGDLTYAIVWLRPSADYVRLEADGRYNVRIYVRGTAYMSRGVCEQ
jgi:hypothetical protein